MKQTIEKPRAVAEKKARERQRAAENRIDPELHAKAARLAKALAPGRD